MAIGGMKKKDGEFHCKSCSKNLIDFRGKPYSKIKTNSTSDTCGVFNKSQIKPYTNYNYYKKSAFKALTILSLIGFNVSPLSANAYSSSTKEKIENQKEKEKKKSKKKKKKRKKNGTLFGKKRDFQS